MLSRCAVRKNDYLCRLEKSIQTNIDEKISEIDSDDLDVSRGRRRALSADNCEGKRSGHFR